MQKPETQITKTTMAQHNYKTTIYIVSGQATVDTTYTQDWGVLAFTQLHKAQNMCRNLNTLLEKYSRYGEAGINPNELGEKPKAMLIADLQEAGDFTITNIDHYDFIGSYYINSCPLADNE